MLAREPAPLGEALGDVLRRDGVELVLACTDRSAPRRRRLRRSVDDGRSCAVTACRRDRPAPAGRGIGLETVGVEPDPHGSRSTPICGRARALGDRRRHRALAADDVGKYQGDVVAANILGDPREANYQALPGSSTPIRRPPRLVRSTRRFSGTPGLGVAEDRDLHACLRRVERFPTLLSDGERLTGAYALGPEAGEWLQQATLAIRRRCRSTC